MKALRVVHTLPSVSEEASGPSYSVRALSHALQAGGVDSVLVVSGRHTNVAGERERTFRRRDFPYKLGRSPDMYSWLDTKAAAGGIDLLHSHGLWMMPNVYPGWVSEAWDIPLIISPRGTFSRWALAQSAFKKWIMWWLLQQRVVSRAAMLHATSEAEYQDIRRMGFKQPVAVISNGIDVPETAWRGGAARRNLLFLSRVHPTKGVDMLLRAWAQVQAAFPDWNLHIVGPGDKAYLHELQQLAASLSAQRVEFLGPLYGIEKERAFKSADLFVLPTHSENFGMAIAEALANGTPVLTTKGAPWSGLFSHNAGWWVDIGIQHLARGLEVALSQSPDTLRRMGDAGRDWMRQDFSWNRIAAQMLESYEWLLRGGSVPRSIHLD